MVLYEDDSKATAWIEDPHDNDVLFGRGNFVNSHAGNLRFRTYVYAQREEYARTPKNKKPIFARLIVNTIRNDLVPPGRFLIQDKSTKLWSDVGDRKAWDKTRQALRDLKEKTPQAAEVSSRCPLGGADLPNRRKKCHKVCHPQRFHHYQQRSCV